MLWNIGSSGMFGHMRNQRDLQGQKKKKKKKKQKPIDPGAPMTPPAEVRQPSGPREPRDPRQIRSPARSPAPTPPPMQPAVQPPPVQRQPWPGIPGGGQSGLMGGQGAQGYPGMTPEQPQYDPALMQDYRNPMRPGAPGGSSPMRSFFPWVQPFPEEDYEDYEEEYYGPGDYRSAFQGGRR